MSELQVIQKVLKEIDDAIGFLGQSEKCITNFVRSCESLGDTGASCLAAAVGKLIRATDVLEATKKELFVIAGELAKVEGSLDARESE